MIGDRVGEALARVEELRVTALRAIESCSTTAELEAARVRFTGKRSDLNQLFQFMGSLPSQDDKKVLGAAINAAKQEIESALAEQTATLQLREMEQRLGQEQIDVTLPGTEYPRGYRHPVLETTREILGILSQLGFTVYEGPEVEWDRYNFELLNIPKHHPARDTQDTFYVSEDIVLRTQTSPGQIRYMEGHQPPIRVAVPGLVYRNEAEDASHLDQFFQIEGLAVDTNITMADLKGTLTEVAHRLFGPERNVRFRPWYFPFTEPSAELDVECAVCHGAGCRSCAHEGWQELLGCGMVHPQVLRNGGYDPTRYSGFAFGMGSDRFTKAKYGITDVRMFRQNDIRFLRQFAR